MTGAQVLVGGTCAHTDVIRVTLKTSGDSAIVSACNNLRVGLEIHAFAHRFLKSTMYEAIADEASSRMNVLVVTSRHDSCKGFEQVMRCVAESSRSFVMTQWSSLADQGSRAVSSLCATDGRGLYTYFTRSRAQVSGGRTGAYNKSPWVRLESMSTKS